jgi:hypothetical protein
MKFRSIALTGAFVSLAAAQQFSPHVGYVYPAGGKQGETFEITVGGQYLDGVNNAYITGAGVQASIVGFHKPINQGQFNRLREELQELSERKSAFTKAQRKRPAAASDSADAAKPEKPLTWTDADEKKVEEIRARMATFIRRPIAPAIVERVRLRVTVAPDAPAGERELRLATPTGMTNPLLFCIGQLAEFTEPPAEPVDEFRSFRANRYRAPGPEVAPRPDVITIPSVVNGQITSGTVDKYRFQAAKGQKLVVSTLARELIPYISDAVPGWFQATVGIYDSKGREVEYAGNFRFHPDPVLYYEVEQDGEYTLAIKDSIYRGREDFVYRITIGELPYVTGVYPLGAKVGDKGAVQLTGWNLPTTRIAVNTREKGVEYLSVSKDGRVSNRMPFVVDAFPEKAEREPNNHIKGAPSVKLPMIVNGRIDKPGDVDVVKFDGKAGEEIVAEVIARRLDSPLDSLLRLTDSSGKQLAANDDFEDKGQGLLTHQADSIIRFKLPRNGAYYVHVADAQQKGGPEYAYRLRISRPLPDFELRVTPASINARPGMSIPVTVYAMRRDGFSGEIALKLKDAPEGFVINGGAIPANEDKVRITLTVPANHIEKPRRITLEGRATVAGKEVRHLAVPSEDMMQAFAYRHLVPAQEWLVRVIGPGRSRGSWKVAQTPVKLPSGGSAPIKLLVPSSRVPGTFKFTLNEPPEGISIKGVTQSRDGVAITFAADPAKAKPGLKGNLIVEGFLEGQSSKQNASRRRQPLGTLPAIPFEVVGM